jgi:ribonuclease BN (tRNA processing enzyme)
LNLRVIGCSPAWHNPGGAQSGYLVEGSGRLLLDCGPGVLARLREQEGWPRVDAVAITHFHLDHWGDLVPWAFGALFGAGRDAPRPELWLPPGGSETVAKIEAALGASAIFDAFAVREYEDATPFHAAGFDVTPLRVPHYDQLTFGMRVSDGARTLAYSGDSAPTPALAEVARDADLFVCEATLAQPEPGLRGHLTEQEAVTAFEDSGARRLLIVHRPSELGLDASLTRAHDGYETAV